ncbi:MAG: hydantoinase B/oxoprolinase family protein [Balneolaceae bacterium]
MAETDTWTLHIDTGGTFTDCLATDPEGKEKRCKVLSSSALRGTLIEKTGDSSIRVRLGNRLPEQFLEGARFRWLGLPEREWVIRTHSLEENGPGSVAELTLHEAITLPEQASGEPAFEILAGMEAPLLAARVVTNTPLKAPLPPLRMRLATTRGTNALLEKKGGKTLFLITKGFRDLLRIGNQQRPELFSLQITKPEPLFHQVVEVPERMDADGHVVEPLDPDALRLELEKHLPEYSSIAVALMHSYKNPAHEHQIRDLLQSMGAEQVSLSSELSPLIHFLNRAQTADINAFLEPVMHNYLRRVEVEVSGGNLYVMSSAGSLTLSEHYRPIDGLLSGPAGGVIGATTAGRRSGYEKVIAFDMGGTSTDVARFDHDFDYLREHTVGNVTLQSPAFSIETVAAGGGSICGFDGESLTVGPESAGANPGPACYGNGGPLTITDINLLTGRLDPSNFHLPVQPEDARQAFDKLYKTIRHRKGSDANRETVLEGFLDIANERMAQAILRISIEKGFDPAEYSLVSFGGAGGQHALAVARKLGIQTVLVPADAGLLSAYGLKQSRIESIRTEQILKPLEAVFENLEREFRELAEEGRLQLRKEGVSEDQITFRSSTLFARLQGQEATLELPWQKNETLTQLQEQFRDHYVRLYGHRAENRGIELESIRVILSEAPNPSQPSSLPSATDSRTEPAGERPLLYGGSHVSIPVLHRETLSPGSRIPGPALLLDPYSTLLIEPGWTAAVRSDRTLEVTMGQRREDNGEMAADSRPGQSHSAGSRTDARPGHTEPEPRNRGSQSPDESRPEESGKTFGGRQQRDEVVNLQLYTNRFTSIAEQMGEMLRRTALSVNVKERLDFSCALLDREGFLVVNAPHIPVHLGAMGVCVRTMMQHIEMNEGDVLVTNHPGFGGSHLPDITVVTPVYHQGERIAFVASRAHHAEIGGKSPGSMPPDANRLSEEGVVIPPMHLIRNGTEQWDSMRQILSGGPWPTRSPEENLADLQAAIAANHRGGRELLQLVARYGIEEVTGYMKRLKRYAAERMKSTLRKIEDGTYRAEEAMDDGSLLSVAFSVDGSSLEIDFTGTSGVHPGNLNANPAIVNSVLIYVLRLLVDEPLPLNDGLLEPVTIRLPESMLNPPFPDDPEECPAVVGGNIETSQRLADTLLKAFGMAACSQGTMNNVLFGNDRFGYYETVAGGTGAGDGFHGADGVHHHMTNTRATDPEILEHRFPVRLNRYEIRRGSGGRGTWNGGDGLIREITFMEPLTLSVLTQHRVVPPYGLSGGEPGQCGSQRILRADGTETALNWRDGAKMQPGDRFILETPGGGGYGLLKNR